MRAIAVLIAVYSVFGASALYADSAIASVQQTLKDQGFYYGEITGTKDKDTTAAIRRYQIRNGLQITGDLNAETRKSLGLKGASAAATPAPTQPSAPNSEPSALPDRPSLRKQEPSIQDDPDYDSSPAPGYSPGYPAQNSSALFQGTPYERAAPGLQQRIIIGAQTLLARGGYYRSGVDGVYGPDTQFALSAYQSRFGIEPSGRLDLQTLAALGLLPGQPAPGVTAPTRRLIPRPRFFPPRERVYIPR